MNNDLRRVIEAVDNARRWDDIEQAGLLLNSDTWAVVDGDLFETWPTKQMARDEMRHFYTESARLCQLVNGEWLDHDGNS